MNKQNLAHYISLFGHPFLTIPVFAVVVLFLHEPLSKAMLISGCLLGGIFIPVAIKTYFGKKTGKYTNYDVSDRRQRQSWYLTTSVLTLLVTLVLFYTNQPPEISFAALAALVQMVLAQLINLRLKVSMHVSYHILLGFLMWPISWYWSIALWCFTPVLAWSRLELGRHTLPEVVAGALLGTAVGLAYLYTIVIFAAS
jgi:membrane-associated phospholipid phosphatase